MNDVWWMDLGGALAWLTLAGVCFYLSARALIREYFDD